MASEISHAVVALAIGRTTGWRAMPARFWWLSVLCSVLPDVDVLGFALGIEYGDLLGHRGLTHSLCFALVLSLVVVRMQFPEAALGSQSWWRLIAHFFLVTASHGFLDAMTNGGLGVAFFAPFDPSRYFLPWRPVEVSPIGLAGFFTPYGAQVLASELMWIWIPVGLAALAVGTYRRLASGRFP
jgi:inner membrane protein